MGAGERGQASVEWVGLALLASLVFTGVLAAAGPRLPGGELVRTIASRIACAASLATDCEEAELGEESLTAAYGPEVAAIVESVAPRIAYEDHMDALPVDFRSCRETSCSDGTAKGAVGFSDAGEPVTAFVRIVDCRGASAADRLLAGEDLDAYEPAPDYGSELPSWLPSSPGRACGSQEAGNLYVQFWFYYPYSNTHFPGEWMAEALNGGEFGGHLDDWETYDVKLTPKERFSRASSHQSFNHDPDVRALLADAGVAPRAGWGADEGLLSVAAGSHAGLATALPAQTHDGPERWTEPDDLRLVALEPLGEELGDYSFAIRPPWLRDSWIDTELERTGY